MRAGVLVGALLTAVLALSGDAQEPRTARGGGDWPMYHHDLAGTGYSPLTQVNVQNVANLTQAWTYRLRSDAAAPAVPTSQATPIVIDGVMYLPAANRVVALEAETGKDIWQSTVTGGTPSRRGVAYWGGEGSTPPRILFMAGR